MRNATVFLLCFLFFYKPVLVYSQNIGINTTGAAPAGNAILDLNTGNNFTSPHGMGLIVPNVPLTGSSDITTIPAPTGGMLVYNSTINCLEYYQTGVGWVAMNCPCNLHGITTYTYIHDSATFTVPACVTVITCTVTGAPGGNGSTYTTLGASGATLIGTLAVNPGDILTVFVGQKGSNGQRGGGGGYSYIYDKTSGTLLALAGAGGGGGGGGGNGCAGQTSTTNLAALETANTCGGGDGQNTGGINGGGGSGGTSSATYYGGGGGAGFDAPPAGTGGTGSYNGGVGGGGGGGTPRGAGGAGVNSGTGGWGGGGGGASSATGGVGAGGGGAGYNGGGGGNSEGTSGGGAGGGSYWQNVTNITSTSTTPTTPEIIISY
jgi:hypothetical protein